MIRNRVRSLTEHLFLKRWECPQPPKLMIEILAKNCLSSLHTSVSAFRKFHFASQQRFSKLPRIRFCRWGGCFAMGCTLSLKPLTVLCAKEQIKTIKSHINTKVGSFSPNGVNTTLHVQLNASLYPETKVISIAFSAKADPVELNTATWIWNGPIKIVCKLMDEQNNLLKAFTIHMSHTGSDEQVFENVDSNIIQKTKHIACSIHV